MPKGSPYNGWANYETWNVALWLQNVESLYELACRYRNYLVVASALHAMDSHETPDGVSWSDPALDIAELDKMLADL